MIVSGCLAAGTDLAQYWLDVAFKADSKIFLCLTSQWHSSLLAKLHPHPPTPLRASMYRSGLQFMLCLVAVGDQQPHTCILATTC